jgi:hypothetical protein
LLPIHVPVCTSRNLTSAIYNIENIFYHLVIIIELYNLMVNQLDDIFS